MSRLVAGDDLKPDEVRTYAAYDSVDDSDAGFSIGSDDREYRHVEFESIDIIEFAPFFVLTAAQEKAQELISRAETEAGQIRDAARQQGAIEGREDAKRGLQPSLVALSDAGQSLIVFEEKLISQYEPHLVQLALEIAAKIIGREVEADEQIVASVLERAKTEVADAKQIRIFLHPDDLAVLREMRPDLVRSERGSGRSLEVFAAPDVARGGCRLETESGIIDATIPTQLDEIQRQLFDHEMVGASSSDIPVLAPAN